MFLFSYYKFNVTLCLEYTSTYLLIAMMNTGKSHPRD